MPLEATMIVVDNSESSRNGDYVPSRWEAQSDAVNMIFQNKTSLNAESSVGLMTMGGKGPEMLVTLTNDFGKLLDGMHRTKIRGTAHLATGLQIAGLALKHRQNKLQKQRIIVFSCSPISDNEKQLVQLAKKLKKNNISVDFIVFGDLEPENTSKLEKFNENVKSSEGCHLAIIPPGPSLLSDHIASSPILGNDGAAPRGDDVGAGGASGGNDFEFGVDPSADPELALALQMSMQEEKARQDKETKSKEAAAKENLESVPEEVSESQPLLDQSGEASWSGSAVKEEEKEEKDDDGDKMDTA